MISREEIRESIKKGLVCEYKEMKKRSENPIFGLRLIIDDLALSSFLMGVSEDLRKEDSKIYIWNTGSWDLNIPLDETLNLDYSLYDATKLFFDYYLEEKDNISDIDEFRLENVKTYMEAMLDFKDEIDEDIFLLLASEDDDNFEYETGKILNFDSKYLKEFKHYFEE